MDTNQDEILDSVVLLYFHQDDQRLNLWEQGIESMELNGRLGLKTLFRHYTLKVITTWGLVLLENVQLALIPLLIGLAIDGLLSGDVRELGILAGVMVVLTVTSVIRRRYDTRTYGTIRVTLSKTLQQRYAQLPVSARSARMDMARELVDFLEDDAPELLTSVVQIIVVFIVLLTFHVYLGLAALVTLAAVMLCYALFHGCFYRYNAAMNEQLEKQVNVLEAGQHASVLKHFSRLRKWEIKLSDAEATVYGLIFLLQILFIVFNLWLSSGIADISAGKIFSIVHYSWEFIGAVLVIPTSLQGFARLHEITERINPEPTSTDTDACITGDEVLRT
ncbi:ABC transporter six-transmembrane domain-containing protein [Endozoicomonas lisbonensis]|uniref:ABC-type bacteriocin/lantibiotic exporter with double-glycine peptidase domain n=2 Tax=Endozoicomonas lisbonensis TaxID=3120522 RepID=A0ABV2SI20_9GAMM